MLLDHSFPRETDYVKKNNIPLVIVGGTVEYHGAHCSYGCDTLVAEGLVKKLSEEFEEIGFYKINTDSNEALAHDCRIRSLPTFIMMSDGKEVGRVFGAKNEKALKELISLA